MIRGLKSSIRGPRKLNESGKVASTNTVPGMWTEGQEAGVMKEENRGTEGEGKEIPAESITRIIIRVVMDLKEITKTGIQNENMLVIDSLTTKIMANREIAIKIIEHIRNHKTHLHQEAFRKTNTTMITGIQNNSIDKIGLMTTNQAKKILTSTNLAINNLINGKMIQIEEQAKNNIQVMMKVVMTQIRITIIKVGLMKEFLMKIENIKNHMITLIPGMSYHLITLIENKITTVEEVNIKDSIQVLTNLLLKEVVEDAISIMGSND